MFSRLYNQSFLPQLFSSLTLCIKSIHVYSMMSACLGDPERQSIIHPPYTASPKPSLQPPTPTQAPASTDHVAPTTPPDLRRSRSDSETKRGDPRPETKVLRLPFQVGRFSDILKYEVISYYRPDEYYYYIDQRVIIIFRALIIVLCLGEMNILLFIGRYDGVIAR